MAAQGWFSRNDVEVAPGSAAVLRLTVVNVGDNTDTFTLTPVGFAAGWTTIRPASVTLFGGAQEDVDVEVAPPDLPSTTAGPTALTIRMVPQREPDDVSSTETSLVIAPTYTRRLNMLQPALRARRSTTFEMMLENRGNTQASCRLHLIDPSGRLDGDFDPPAAGVEPGASTLIRLKVKAKHPLWDRRSRSIQFAVDADQPGCPTASAPVTFVQAPMFPEQLLGKLAGAAAAVAVLVAGWYAIAKPAINRSVDKAVASRAPIAADGGVAVATTTTLATTDTTAASGPAVSPDQTGRAIWQSLAPAPQPGDTQEAALDVPAGSNLEITDLLLRNPRQDSGPAALLSGDVEINSWRLEDMTTPERPYAFRSPIVIPGGTKLRFTVTCTAVGNSPTGESLPCGAVLLVIGRLVPA